MDGDARGLPQVQAHALGAPWLQDKGRDTKGPALPPRVCVCSTTAQQPQGTRRNFCPLENTGILRICPTGHTAAVQRHPGIGMSREVKGEDRDHWEPGEEERPLISGEG